MRERRMVMWVTCGEAELVSTRPKLSFSLVTMFRNSSTRCHREKQQEGKETVMKAALSPKIKTHLNNQVGMSACLYVCPLIFSTTVHSIDFTLRGVYQGGPKEA